MCISCAINRLSLMLTRAICGKKPSSDLKIECIFNTHVTITYANDVIVYHRLWSITALMQKRPCPHHDATIHFDTPGRDALNSKFESDSINIYNVRKYFYFR